jgi:hypothetical protein
MSQRFIQLETAFDQYRCGNMPECDLKNASFRDWMTWAIRQPVNAFDSIESDRESPDYKWDCRTYRLAAGRLHEACEELRPRPSLEAFRSVAGWLSDAEANALQRIAAGATVLEVGTWKAKSAIAMAAVAFHVVTVDHFAGDGFAGVGNPGTQAWENVVRAEAQERVTMMFTPWDQAKRFIDINDFEVIFYDGDHTFEATRNVLAYIDDQMAWDAVIAVHDYDDKPQHWGCRKAVDEFALANDYRFELHDTLAILTPTI